MGAALARLQAQKHMNAKGNVLPKYLLPELKEGYGHPPLVPEDCHLLWTVQTVPSPLNYFEREKSEKWLEHSLQVAFQKSWPGPPAFHWEKNERQFIPTTRRTSYRESSLTPEEAGEERMRWWLTRVNGCSSDSFGLKMISNIFNMHLP